MSKGFFITGTDTGIGKTFVTLMLMEEFKRQGLQVAGMKPIASGAELKSGTLINQDAELIMNACSKQTDYKLVNPFVFELPVSPHIAANQTNKTIDLEQIDVSYRQLASDNDLVFVEGVGGWRVPVTDELTLLDLVRKLDIPVILVVGLKLGCINHAILTAESIKADGLELHGWVSNRLDKDYLLADETIKMLKTTLPCPLVTDIHFSDAFEAVGSLKEVNLLLDSKPL